MLSRLIKSVVVALAMISTSAGAFAQGTMQQENACRGDVFRLCGRDIPDVDAIVACLRDNAARLSEPCHEDMFPGHAEQDSDERTERARSGDTR